MKRNFVSLFILVTILAMALASCAPAAPVAEQPAAVQPTQAPAAAEPTTAPVAAATAAPTAYVEPTLPPEIPGKTRIRWFVGLGTGTDPAQQEVQQQVVDDFNAANPDIQLVLEVVPYDSARDTLATQIASGAGPDIVGPVGWGGSNAFYGQWLDLTPYIQKTSFDTSVFDPALVKFYQTEEGQVGLPFAVYPSAVFFRPDLFDEVGLKYPPQKYGDKYELDGKQVDWSWTTLEEVARRLTLDKNGNNSTEDGFDATTMTQVGFALQWEEYLPYIGSYHSGSVDFVNGDSKGNYSVNFPDSWKQDQQWFYDAIWGKQPFMATGPLEAAPEFGNGNTFNMGHAAMAMTPIWYTCCMTDFAAAGFEFQAGIMPTNPQGEVTSRVDADTFRIWKGTKHPNEAFTVLSYLLTTGGDKLLPTYGAMPAIATKMQSFFDAKSKDYPFVTQASWDVFKAGLAYPDNPSSEQFQPNWNEAWAREQTFTNLELNTPPDQFNFDTEWQKLIDDLNVIYNK